MLRIHFISLNHVIYITTNILIAPISTLCSGVDRSQIVFLWFPVLINMLRITPFELALIVASFQLILIANEIAPSGSDVDRSQIVFVWFPVLINMLIFDLALIVIRLYPCDDINSQENLSCTWIDTFSETVIWSRHSLHPL